MRSKLKSFLSSFVAALLLATLIIPIAACTDGGSGGGSGNTVVSVVSMGNKGLSDVTVTAKSGNKSATGKTNANGNVSLNLDKSLTYQVTFDNLPKGYYTDPSFNYSIKANNAGDVKFYMPSKVIVGESVDPSYDYKTGDVMYDFEFTTTVGANKVKLSEQFELYNQKAVLINFWGTLCSNCELEFPAIEETYQMFKDQGFTVMAIDPPRAYGDDNNKILTTLQSWARGWDFDNLSFYYGLDAADIYKNFYPQARSGKSSLPISVIIDRYGVICEIIVGSKDDPEVWQNAIAKYVSDDYVPDIDEGKTAGEIENFVPDLPADYGAVMSDPDDIDRAINNTGKDITFHADMAEYSWPWALSSDGSSVVPLGSGHGRSYSILYAEIEMDTDEALLVRYKVSSQEDYDMFEIVVDNNDLGRVTLVDSGNKGWQTALAYIPLTAGNHQIAFVYYKGTIDGKYEDTVYIDSLTIEPVTSEKIPSADISYYAAREYNLDGTYSVHEQAYYDNTDGYYHVKGYTGADGKDPYLLLDMMNMIPYTRSASLYEQYISGNNCTFGGKNYYNQLLSYSYVAGNSKVEGAVPVTQELQVILDALCKQEADEYGYDYTDDLWLEFCIFFLHYGEGKSMDDPVKGLAYFSAYEADVTEVYDAEKMQGLISTIRAAQEALTKPGADVDALNKIIKDAQDEYETYLATFPSVDFDSIYVPRGKMVKFTAPENGVYHFYSVGREDNPEYVCEAQLFDGDLKLNTALARPIASHDSDTLFRDGSPSQFHLYHYLKQGESCYLNLMFYSTETMEPMYYAINKVHDTEYKTLKTVTSGFLVASDEPGHMGELYRPLYVNGVAYNAAEDYYYETSFGHEIYVDFTGVTRGSTSHTLEQVIEAINAGTPLKQYGEDVNFDFTGYEVRIGRPGDPNYEVIEGKDYTDTMCDYLLEVQKGSKDDPEYGLVKANKELRNIFLLFITKYSELTVEEDWLMYCYYYEYFGANY